MNDGPTNPSGRAEARRYAIRLMGHLDARRAAWFDGLSLELQDDGSTVLSGPVTDQAALHGLLQRIRDLGLPLVSVTRVDEPPDRSARPEPAPSSPRTPVTGPADA